jgi:RsiW-degrading membrane proteinase PrsW (M82 family)
VDQPPAPPVAPGWYPDPWRVAAFRWWDGRVWTPHAVSPTPAPGAATPPRLGSWLSVPVVVGLLLVGPVLGTLLVTSPEIAALALVPLVFVVPVLVWTDRLEPEPRAARAHAFLWGATVAIVVASVVNGVVLATVGEAAAVVGSAPVIEETMKALAVVVAVRRGEVDGPVDGIVYAGWVAAGFAVVENVEYFLTASSDGVLEETFVLRALLTPFTHPLFTAWAGVAIGRAVVRGRPLGTAWWGVAVAMALHAAWNGSLVAFSDQEDTTLLAGAAAAFVGIFVLSVVLLAYVRHDERRDYVAAAPAMAERYGIPAGEVGTFATWRELLAARKRLPKPARQRFDDLHAALARLAALHARSQPVDPAVESRLVGQLETARRAIR